MNMANTDQPPGYTETQNIISQPSVTVQPDPTSSNTSKTRGTWKSLRITGYVQVGLGILSVLLGVVSVVFRAFAFFVGYAIWCGICFYIVTGIIGVAAAGKRKSCLVVFYLIMSILSAIFAAAVIIVAGIGMTMDQNFCPDWMFEKHFTYMYIHDGCSTTPKARMAIDAVILAISLGEMIVAIIGASFTCMPLCCTKTSYPMQVYYQSAPGVIVAGQPQPVVHYAGMPQQQFVPQPQPGSVIYPSQHAQPMFPPPGPMQYYPMAQTTPQAVPLAVPLAQAQSMPQQAMAQGGTPGFNLQSDQYNKPPIP